MKTVYDSRMVSHLWAHQKQDHARNSRDNVSFCGNEMFSYSTVVAKHVKNKRGEQAVVITTRTYSNTTAKHMSWIRGAASHLTCFHVLDIHAKPRDMLKDYADQLVLLIGKWHRARTGKPWIMEQIQRVVREGNHLAEFYGLKQRLGDPEDMDGMIEASRKIEESRQRAARREETKRQKAIREGREKWLSGEADYYPDEHRDTVIRLRVKGEELQTSRGARVPLEHAVKAFKFIKRCHDRQDGFQRNGKEIRLGHFQIDRIDEQGNVIAGCHSVQWEEILRIAKEQGLVPAA